MLRARPWPAGAEQGLWLLRRVWSLAYNPFHDQLVLTSGSDARVVLASAASLSSDIYARLADGADPDASGSESSSSASLTAAGGGGTKLADGLVCAFDEHEESVYRAAWAATDPWVCASLSLDGRFVLNHVPRDVKYGILL